MLNLRPRSFVFYPKKGGKAMKKITGIVVLFLLVGFGYASAQQTNLGGTISPPTLKVTYANKIGSGSTKYKTLVTVTETLDNPYLYFVWNPSTGKLENIVVYASVNGTEINIIGCTPGLVANAPPKTGLTFQIQGMAACTFCPESGVAGPLTCNNSSESPGVAYLSLTGTGYMNNRTDQIVTKLVLRGTTGGGGFQYVPTGSTTGYNAIFTGTFSATLEPMTTPP
jgi:hypothetical protein